MEERRLTLRLLLPRTLIIYDIFSPDDPLAMPRSSSETESAHGLGIRIVLLARLVVAQGDRPRSVRGCGGVWAPRLPSRHDGSVLVRRWRQGVVVEVRRANCEETPPSALLQGEAPITTSRSCVRQPAERRCRMHPAACLILVSTLVQRPPRPPPSSSPQNAACFVPGLSPL